MAGSTTLTRILVGRGKEGRVDGFNRGVLFYSIVQHMSEWRAKQRKV